MVIVKRGDTHRKDIGFAVVILTAGVIWLLYNINLISAAGVNIVLNLWPLALIAIGVDILLRQQAHPLAAWVVPSIAVFVVLVAVIAPPLGIGIVKTTTNTYNTQLDRAESATINLYPSVGEVDIYALETEAALFSAEATYIGEDITFDVTGTSRRQIDFGQNEVRTTSWLGTDKPLRWNIGLTPAIPLRLSINTGVGDSDLDLADLNLTGLTLNSGVGRVNLTLPDQETPYQITVTGGVGDFKVQFPENADVDLTFSSGVGDLDVDLPDDAAIRVSVTSGLGSVHLPSWLTNVDPDSDDQIWQSEGYETASRQINIHVESGLGSLTIN